MSTINRVATEWLRRIVLAKYSPEFYRWVMNKRFPSPNSEKQVLFHSLPSEMQQRIHDRWQSSKAQHATRMPKRDFQKLRDRAQDAQHGYDIGEQEQLRQERKELARQIKKLKERGAPQRIIEKERKRMLQEMKLRSHQRRKQRTQPG